MEGRFIAFGIWGLVGLLFIVMGIYDFNSKKAKPFGFWANVKVASIEDVKGYNRALGILWMVYGVLFTLIGLPLLAGQNSPFIYIGGNGYWHCGNDSLHDRNRIKILQKEIKIRETPTNLKCDFRLVGVLR